VSYGWCALAAQLRSMVYKEFYRIEVIQKDIDFTNYNPSRS
jgi:hypothetical protein